jgi:hypothetical protein
LSTINVDLIVVYFSKDVLKTQPELKIILKSLRVGTEQAQELVIEEKPPLKNHSNPYTATNRSILQKNQPISHLSSSVTLRQDA